MKYEEALESLNCMTKFGINLGLERIKSLLSHLGNPQESLKFIHVAGTNGKGSTAALLQAILIEAGYKTGLYTSPHLISYTERINVDSRPITKESFAEIMGELKEVYDKVQKDTGENPTEFEVLTAMAFLYFARCKTDIVVLEVGLGGDLDSTNIIASPEISIITNVSIDHTDHLGATTCLIADKKSGIIKKGCPVITASNDEEVLKVLKDKASALQAPFYQVQEEVLVEYRSESLQEQLFMLKTRIEDYGMLRLPLLGEHQILNAATAVLAAEILAGKGWRITAETIRSGLAAVRWPGRLEVLWKDPLLILDGAHNAAGMEVLSKWLVKNRLKYKKLILVIGMLDDKEREKSVDFIKCLVDRVIVTRPCSPRTEKWSQLALMFNDSGRTISIVEDIEEAVEIGLKSACPGDMVLVTGSLYLIGDVRKVLLSL